jgi:hypothetical protein
MNKKAINEQLFVSFTSYDQLHYIKERSNNCSVKLIYNRCQIDDVLIWYDAEMNDREYIIINNNVEYLDCLTTLTDPDLVIQKICDNYGVTRADISDLCRKAEFREPRHIIFYILRTYYHIELQVIANMFNRKAHATVINGIKNVKNLIAIKPSYGTYLDSYITKTN